MKPIVHFIGDATFVEYGGFEQASVHAVDHPFLGNMRVTTSAILEKFDDGSFETRNSMYIPVKENE